MKVSAIVVTYNRLSLLKECLQHLINQSYKLNNIYVINNHSTDDTKKYLSTVHNPLIHSVTTSKNLGGAGGFSLGTKLAFENSDSEYFWLMDDDTMPEKNSLEKLRIAANRLHDHFGFLCSNVRWWKDLKPAYVNIPYSAPDWTDKINEGLAKVTFASFVSLLVPRTSVEKFGLPIGEMFIWGDDVEYTTRISKHLPSYLVTNSIVLHKSGSNGGTNSVFNEPMNRLPFYRYLYRNRLFICRKFYKKRKFLKKLLLYLIILFKIPFKADNHRFQRFMYALEGIIWGFYFNPSVKFPYKR